MSGQWGPWMSHDGKGHPKDAIGRVCQVIDYCANKGIKDAGEHMIMGTVPSGGSWNWDNFPACTKVIRYRIRKPKGMRFIDAIMDQVSQADAQTLEIMHNGLHVWTEASNKKAAK